MTSKRDLLKRPGVNLVYTGTKRVKGIDTGTPAIVVAVTKKHTRETLSTLGLELIPAEIQSLPTDVVEGGPFKVGPDIESKATPIDDPREHQKKFRPTVPGGVSAIVCGSSACTTTCWVPSKKLNRPVLLHNWHCSYLSACNDMKTVQPSPYDGGFHPQDDISTVTAGDIDTPTTDSAIDIPLDNTYATKLIFGLGEYAGYTTPNIGDPLVKSGRTTGITKGSCTATDGAANVQYPDKIRLKTDLIVTTDMLAGGDSSSPLMIGNVDNGAAVIIDKRLAGQGFAGGGGMSLFVKISNILTDPAIAPYELDFEGETPVSPQLFLTPTTLVPGQQFTYTVNGTFGGHAFELHLLDSARNLVTYLDRDVTPADSYTRTLTFPATVEYSGQGYVQFVDVEAFEGSNLVSVTVMKQSTCNVGNGTARVLNGIASLFGRHGRFKYLVS